MLAAYFNILLFMKSKVEVKQDQLSVRRSSKVTLLKVSLLFYVCCIECYKGVIILSMYIDINVRDFQSTRMFWVL